MKESNIDIHIFTEGQKDVIYLLRRWRIIQVTGTYASHQAALQKKSPDRTNLFFCFIFFMLILHL